MNEAMRATLILGTAYAVMMVGLILILFPYKRLFR